MRNTSSSNHVPRVAPLKYSNIHRQKHMNYADLENELTRLRARLACETRMSHLITSEPELFPDPIDQAAAEYESDIALSVKLLTIEKLRRIEQALTSLHTRSYGICSRCNHQIPPARLRVQPDSLYCVPCLTTIEQQSDGS
ncbi:MAG: TraR/DksA family transcriptional regulator [Nitrospira sp.]|nr:MAG: TraR/DksA family transcriptional regulator [Nitrospira sp.]